MDDQSLAIRPIARIRNDLEEKFGVPRQSGLVPELISRVVFEPAYAEPAAVRGLEGFSHIWLIWGFSQARRRGSHENREGIGSNRENTETYPENIESNRECIGSNREDIESNREGIGSNRENTKSSRDLQAEEETSQVNCESMCPDSTCTDSTIIRQQKENPWSPTVRPPRLGGNERMGVFATRSPFRPNGLGLSCVELKQILYDREEGGLALEVAGADLMDGTPIYDIKPYLPFTDARPQARGGFVETTPRLVLKVEFPEKLRSLLPADKAAAAEGILAQDPRPAYQDDPERVYGLRFAGFNIRFRVEGETLIVMEVTG